MRIFFDFTFIREILMPKAKMKIRSPMRKNRLSVVKLKKVILSLKG
jgi:hypothetical protein